MLRTLFICTAVSRSNALPWEKWVFFLIFTVTCNLEVVSRECQFASRLLKHMVGFQNEGAVKVAAQEQCGNRMKFAAFIDNPEQKICSHCQKLRAGRIETHIDRCSCLLDFGTQFE